MSGSQLEAPLTLNDIQTQQVHSDNQQEIMLQEVKWKVFFLNTGTKITIYFKIQSSTQTNLCLFMLVNFVFNYFFQVRGFLPYNFVEI